VTADFSDRRVFELAIAVIGKGYLFDAEDVGGGLLFGPAVGGDIGGGVRGIVCATVAGGEDEQVDRGATGGPFGQRAAGGNVDVVGVSANGQHHAGLEAARGATCVVHGSLRYQFAL
jgi:hypothetical protein